MRLLSAPRSIGITLGLAMGLCVATVAAIPAQSREADRTLKLYFAHTGERGEFTFKKNGRYDRAALEKINRFLRDWRADKSIQMDPHLLDIVWTVYQESGSKDYIHVVSAYRSPSTNEMLRSRSSGVAKNSQHRVGKAMDWFVTDVPLSKLRELAVKLEGGGVGYYPRSGSPFVHTDTGSVRAWPRMSRQQLVALFPKGHTLHLPADGKPLPGYEQAVAQRKAAGATALAFLENDPTDNSGDRTGTASWLKRVFPGKQDSEVADSEDAEGGETAAPVEVAALEDADAADDAAELARLPRARPGGDDDTDADSDITADGGMILASADPSFVLSVLDFDRGADAGGFGIRPNAGDAIASLLGPGQGARDRPLELAYAAGGAGLPSEADRAILAAFAAVDHSRDVRQADAALVVAATRRAVGAPEERLAMRAFALATAAPLNPRQSNDNRIAAGNGAFVLAASEVPVYDGDEDALLDLLDNSGPAPDPAVAKLEMPEPRATDVYSAPEAATDVADLRGDAGPPINHFAPTEGAKPDERGFFRKLFASLIE